MRYSVFFAQKRHSRGQKPRFQARQPRIPEYQNTTQAKTVFCIFGSKTPSPAITWGWPGRAQCLRHFPKYRSAFLSQRTRTAKSHTWGSDAEDPGRRAPKTRFSGPGGAALGAMIVALTWRCQKPGWGQGPPARKPSQSPSLPRAFQAPVGPRNRTGRHAPSPPGMTWLQSDPAPLA
jgi:hypothetical protein